MAEVEYCINNVLYAVKNQILCYIDIDTNELPIGEHSKKIVAQKDGM